jgi:hypothetical protein
MTDDDEPFTDLTTSRPIIFVRRVKCPACHGIRHKTTRSVDQGDGSRLHWKTCQTCQKKFFVCVE